jgi:hypothetical protein
MGHSEMSIDDWGRVTSHVEKGAYLVVKNNTKSTKRMSHKKLVNARTLDKVKLPTLKDHIEALLNSRTALQMMAEVAEKKSDGFFKSPRGKRVYLRLADALYELDTYLARTNCVSDHDHQEIKRIFSDIQKVKNKKAK